LMYGHPDKDKKEALIPIGQHRFFSLQNWVVLEFTKLQQHQFHTLNWVMGLNKYPGNRIKNKQATN
ncbi:MAG: hypothetical protein AAF598_13965, partial [Bacteroidota bacterium]